MTSSDHLEDKVSIAKSMRAIVIHDAFGDQMRSVASFDLTEVHPFAITGLKTSESMRLLDYIYRITNSIDEPWFSSDAGLGMETSALVKAKGGCRSTSVGDYIIIGHDPFIVADFGFELVSPHDLMTKLKDIPSYQWDAFPDEWDGSVSIDLIPKADHEMHALVLGGIKDGEKIKVRVGEFNDRAEAAYEIDRVKLYYRLKSACELTPENNETFVYGQGF